MTTADTSELELLTRAAAAGCRTWHGDGERAKAAADRLLWRVFRDRQPRRALDAIGRDFYSATAALWASCRTQSGDCPVEATRLYARAALEELRPQSRA